MISRRVLGAIGISAAVVVITAAIWEAVLNDLNDHLKQAVESIGREVNPFSHPSYGFDHEDGLEPWVY